ncbi:MlaD family protein [Primorskyibacter sp. S187A]|uniref:PqiB family protein n=1 Tax=Primorskyibacter sp. S187A TaxID=3415130 RepID=UPI003C7D6FA9
MSQTPPPLPIEPPQPGVLSRVSLIWLIPLGAIVTALAIAWSSYANQGRIIHVMFENGAGLSANSTELRFRDVTVGVVEDIGLTDGLEAVDVAIRLDRDIAAYVDDTAQFWVVRPEVTTQGITGLDTVLSGVYIEGSWDTEIGAPASTFRGRPEPPLFRSDQPGLQISLRSTQRGTLSAEGPILYRGIEVGRIGKAFIDPVGNFAVAEAVIYEPHDRLINDNTRFWDTSGFSLSVGASGASLDFSSLASLVAGGITFETFVSGGAPATAGTQFQVYGNEDGARDSIFNQSLVEDLSVSVIFDDNISGLNIGAPVELAGLRIGAVSSVFGVIDAETFGDNRVRLNAVLEIQPTRLGLEGEATADAALDFLRLRAGEGLRAQLASASLLAGGLKVQFVATDNTDGRALRETAEGLPVLPSIPSEMGSGQASVEGVLNRVSSLPVEELMQSAIDFLDTARSFVSSDALRETPEDLRALLSSITDVVQSDDVQAVAGNLNQVLSQTETLLADLERAQTVQRLADAVDAAARAADAVDSSVEGLPALLEELTTVAQSARDLPLDVLTERVIGVMDAADDILQNTDVQELPEDLRLLLASITDVVQSDDVQAVAGNLNQVLGQTEALLRDLEEAQTIQRLAAAVDSAATAAAAVESSVDGMPGLLNELTEVARTARALPLDALTERVTGIVETADGLLQSDGVQELPEQLNAALEELNLTLSELRAGGAVDNMNATLASARDAADAVAGSTRDLPALVTRLTQVLNQASATISGYDKGDTLSRDAQAALRDIQKAASAITSLARTIERNPSALIRGRN